MPKYLDYDGLKQFTSSLGNEIRKLSPINILEGADPDVLSIQYSTQPNGWRLHASQTGGASGTLYINDPELDTVKNYSKIITLDPTKSTSVNIQNINSAFVPGDFEFGLPTLKPILNKNIDFSDGEDEWNFASGTSLVTDYSEKSEGEPVISLNTSSTSYNFSTSSISFEANKEYEVSFKMKCSSSPNKPTLNITLAYYKTASHTTTCPTADYIAQPATYRARVDLPVSSNEWHNVNIKFTTSGTYTGGIKFQPTYTANAPILFKDIRVKKISDPILPTNWNNWVRESWYYPMSPNSDGTWVSTTVYGISDDSNPTTLAKKTDIVLPSGITEYELGIEAKRVTPSYQWQDYTTLTPADKYALMNENTSLSECPKLGGPWTNALEKGYCLRFLFNNNLNIYKASLLTSMPGVTKSRLYLNRLYNNKKLLIPRASYYSNYNENINGSNIVDDMVRSISAAYYGGAVHATELILEPAGNIHSTNRDKNIVKNIKMFASVGNGTNIKKHYPITSDYHGNLYCHGIKADNYIGFIDDGELKAGV